MLDAVAFWRGTRFTQAQANLWYNSGNGEEYYAGVWHPCGSAFASLNNQLVAHWHFDEATGTRVDSINAMNLTMAGSVTQAAGLVGSHQSAAFPGGNANYLQRNAGLTPLNWNANGMFECNLWAMLTDTGNHYMMDLGITFTNVACNVMYSQTSSNFRAWSNSVQLDNAAAGIPAVNTWYNLSWGDDGTNAFFYVNNANLLQAARVLPGAAQLACTNVIFGNNDAFSQYHTGRIDCCSLWLGRSLTATERGWLYNAGAGLEYPY
jgi:hypothetical protein